MKVAEGRAKNLQADLRQVEADDALDAGPASKFFGKFGFAAAQIFGQYGRAKLRPFSRRAHEEGRHRVLNPQLRSAIKWWLQTLIELPHREVPVRVDQMHRVVSYSGGEGSMAGVGVVVRSNRFTGEPIRVGRADLPTEIREYWKRSLPQSDDSYDIQDIEGVGPAMALHNIGFMMSHALWIHFIDNNGALPALVNGGASIYSTDIIASYTWQKCQELRVRPWFDRVDTHTNISDGASRNRWTKLRAAAFGMPWKEVRLNFPANLRSRLRDGLSVPLWEKGL